MIVEITIRDNLKKTGVGGQKRAAVVIKDNYFVHLLNSENAIINY